MKTAIILAGGQGTRLRSMISALPKPMAPIQGVPFLEHLLEQLQDHAFEKVILSVGYKHEAIIDHYGKQYKGLNLSYAIEEEPLGTGGGIRLAMQQVDEAYALILNGDSIFDIDLHAFAELVEAKRPDFALAAKEMSDFERYGCVSFDDQNQISAFIEKKPTNHGFINAGIYALQKDSFMAIPFAAKFSFEQSYMETQHQNLDFRAFPMQGYFLDIGIPKDYEIAQQSLPHLSLKRLKRNIHSEQNWSLFLDRDGVLNRRIVGDYVRNPDQLELFDNLGQDIHSLNQTFQPTVIVTNQQGIGKGLMTDEDLVEVHAKLSSEISKFDGRIDKFYCCPKLAKEDPNCRKPNPGMAFEAQQDYPSIDFRRSLMIGDSPSDITFGIQLNMKTIFIDNKRTDISFKKGMKPDATFASLHEFAVYLRS